MRWPELDLEGADLDGAARGFRAPPCMSGSARKKRRPDGADRHAARLNTAIGSGRPDGNQASAAFGRALTTKTCMAPGLKVARS